MTGLHRLMVPDTSLSIAPRKAILRRSPLAVQGLLGLLGCLLPGFSSAQFSGEPQEQTWVTNGRVSSIVTDGDTTFIGGDFDAVGPNTGCGVPIDLETGDPVTQYPRVNGTVWASAPDGAGGWYIGGDFTRVGKLNINYLAHILADGSVDRNWNPNPQGAAFGDSGVTTIRDIEVVGDNVLVAGRFGTIGEEGRRNVAMLDAATGLARYWSANTDRIVYDILVDGEQLYMGGAFQKVNGFSFHSLVSVSMETGELNSWYPNVNATVACMEIAGSNLYIGGAFSKVGTNVRSNAAAVNLTTGIATAWSPNPDDLVTCLNISGPTVYIGGEFDEIGTETRPGLAALSLNWGNSTDWDPGTYHAHDIEVVNGVVYVAGEFSTGYGDTELGLKAFDPESGEEVSTAPITLGPAYTLSLSGSTMYVGGNFGSIGGELRSNLAAIDAQTGMVTPWNPVMIPDRKINYVNAIALSDDLVYVGGAEMNVNGSAAYNVAAIRRDTGAQMNIWNPIFDGVVNTLSVANDSLYVGGYFANIDWAPKSLIARLDLATGEALPWDPVVAVEPGFTGVVNTIVTKDGTAYFGGYFNQVGGETRHSLAAVDALTGELLPWNPSPDSNGWISCMTPGQDSFFVGGDFTTIGSEAVRSIAEINIKTGLPTSFDCEVDGAVYAIAVTETNVFAGGSFNVVGGENRKSLAAINRATGETTYWNPGIDRTTPGALGPAKPAASVLEVSGSTLRLGGDFQTVGGSSRPNLATFRVAPHPPVGWIVE